MITRKTALVLGAGASVDFGFPTGYDLLTEMTRSLLEDCEGWHRLRGAGFGSGHIESFRAALARSGRLSVDAFLEHREEFVGVGKAAIASFLLPRERDDSLFGFSAPRPNWYEYLFQAMNAELEDFGQNELGIVTFNYDRSLEYALFTFLTNAYPASRGAVVEALGSVPIVHVYGDLGPLHELEGRGVPFGADSEIRTSAEHLRILHEGSEDDEALQKARELLLAAERICFLGFGYDATNLERLGGPRLSSGTRSLFGSAYGLLNGEIESLIARFDTNIRLSGGEQDCRDCLRELGIFG